MGWLGVAVSAFAALLFYSSEHWVLMALAIVAAVGSFWSFGVMHNYATEIAKQRRDYTGGFYDITEEEAAAVPDWLAIVNLVFSVGGLILFISALIMRWFS